MNDPCENENCLRCHPELKTFEVERERVERIVRSLEVRAVDESAALAAFLKEASGPGSYLHDMGRGPLLELKDPVVKQVEEHPAHCWHDSVYHRAGCTIRVPRDPADEYAGRFCDCMNDDPYQQWRRQQAVEKVAARSTATSEGDLFMELSSCDACGDAGCSDPECWRCHSPIGPSQLQRLATNLATAALLCHAWQQRAAKPEWFPGCALQ
jgi:hypothetical protein